MANLRNFTGCNVTSTGTGTMSLGAKIPGHRTFDSAFPADKVTSYTAVNPNGDREAGLGLYSKVNNTLARGLVDSTTGALLDLAAGAVVFVDFLAQDAPTDWPVFVGNSQGANNGAFQQLGTAFSTIQLNNVVTDTHAGWDALNFQYTFPQSGSYDVQGKMRLVDNSQTNGNGISHGIGMDTANQDSPAFLWATFPNGNQTGNGAARFTLYNSRLFVATKGMTFRLFGYADVISGTAGINAAELVITRVR